MRKYSLRPRSALLERCCGALRIVGRRDIDGQRIKIQ